MDVTSADREQPTREAHGLTYLGELTGHILESAHDIIVATDREGLITFFNSAAERFSGYSREEVLSTHLCSLYRDPDECYRSLARIMDTGQPHTIEAVVRTKQGQDRLFSVSRAPLKDHTGSIIGFVATTRDVTEQRQADERIRVLEEFRTQILNATHDAIVATDRNGVIRFTNPAAERVSGFREWELLGRHICEFDGDPPACRTFFQETALSEEVFSYETALVRKDGAACTLAVSRAPLHDREGNITGFVSSCRDLTQRRETIETLRHVQHFLEQILNSAHDIIVATDLDGAITYFNQTAVEITGYSQAEAAGMNVRDLYKDPEFAHQQLQIVEKTGRVNSYEGAILDKQHREHIIWVNKAPLLDPEGRIEGFVAVSRDITKRKKAEEKVQELSDILSRDPSIQVEPYLLRKRVSELMNSRPVTCRNDEGIGRVLKKLIDNDVPLVPVLDVDGRVLGTISLKDLAAERLFGRQEWRGMTAGDFVNRTFFSIEKEAFFFDALAVMVKSRADSLMVLEQRFLVGVLSTQDILRYRGLGVFTILDTIEGQETLMGLSSVRFAIIQLVQSLLSEGALPSQVCTIITEFNDRITRRVLEMTLERMGPPPAPFAWIGLGSEGRKEQTLVTDQDNGIIIDCADPMPREVADYFGRFTERVIEGLDACGFPRCPGGMMASSPDWSGTPASWMQRINRWITDAGDDHLLAFITFADLRFIHGDEKLYDGFHRTFLAGFRENPGSLTYVAEAALRQTPPLNLFRQFMVEKSGPRKGKLNVKNNGTLMVINLVRVFALVHGVTETNTWERIRVLQEREVFTPEEAESLKEAFNHLVELRLKNMVKALLEGREPDSYIDPYRLSPWAQRMLKEAYEVIGRVHKMARDAFYWLR